MDYNLINKNSIKIIEVLRDGKLYFNEIYERTKIKSKNNLLKNLDVLTKNKVLIKEKNKSNTYYFLNYSKNLISSILNLINQLNLEKLPYKVKKSISESVIALKPRMAVLFGSYAKGDYKEKSDIDMVFFDSLGKKQGLTEISKNYGVKLNGIFMKFSEINLKNESLRHIFKTGFPITGEMYFYDKIRQEI